MNDDIRKFMSRMGKRGARKRWDGTTEEQKNEAMKQVRAARTARKALARQRNGKGGG